MLSAVPAVATATPVETVNLAGAQDLHRYDGYLSQPASGAALDIALNFVTDHAGEMGLAAADFSQVRLSDQYADDDSGISHIYLRQQYRGLDISGADMVINVAADGSVINVAGSFIAGLSSASRAATEDSGEPQLTAGEALGRMAPSLGLTMSDTTAPQWASGAEATTLTDTGLSLDPIPAKLQYVVGEGGDVVLAWDFVLRTPDGDHWYDASADASSGNLVELHDWVNQASYNVFACPVETPADGARTVVTNPQDNAVSPYGWHDANGVAGAEYTDTRGNNVFAQEDTNYNNSGGFRPDGGASLNFDFPLDLTQAPSSYQSAAITNLFYWNNVCHDIHARYGFTEQAGNFQVTNYTGLGAGNDAVQADAQDGGGTDNANFATPPDGYAPRMQMYVFTQTSPRRDGDLDNQIITHEYGHGVSNRLVGGPSNVYALDAAQSEALGEGWSDWWSLMFTQKASDHRNARYPVGGYVMGQGAGGEGIRRYPYCFDMNVNPLTFGDIYYNSECHDAGEVWCSALWDMNWLLIDRYGFSSDIAAGYSAGAAGNVLALKLVMDSLKLMPSDPTFLQARDAILLADVNLTNGANQAAIWNAFARRGMGASASSGSSTSMYVTEAFDLPVSARGTVSFSEHSVDLGTAVTINVRDSHLSGSASCAVSVVSSVGDSEIVTLMAQGGGVFQASLSTAAGSVAPGDGLIQVVVGGTFTVTYTDANDGSGLAVVRTDQATAVQHLQTTTSSPLPAAQRFVSYSNSLAASGGQGSYTWSVIDGYQESSPTATWLGGGTAKYWYADDSSWSLSLPWSFPFYGTNYNSVYVCSNGYLDFTSAAALPNNGDWGLISATRIAPMWDDLTTSYYSDDIFVTSTADYVAVRWAAHTYTGSYAVRAEAVLYPNGSIRFDYDGAQSGMTPTIGVSQGDGVHYTLCTMDGHTKFPATTSLLLSPLASVPTGLSLSPTGVLSGTATAPAGGYDFLVRVADSGLLQRTDTKSFHIDLVTLPALAISVPTDAVEGTSPMATITLPAVSTSDVVLTLSCSNPSRVAVPASVTIPAGQTSATWPMTIPDNALLDGPETVTIAAAATGYTSASGTLAVHDNETATLSVSLPASAVEGNGVLTAAGTITASQAPSRDLVVQLTSSDTTEVTVLPVTLRAGQTTATFNLTIVDDVLIDGTQLATVTAHVENWVDGSTSISVGDNDRYLTVTLPTDCWESQGTISGSVGIRSPLATNLVVSLESADTSELTVPATVTILAGQTSATFTASIVDDVEGDGAQTVTVTASEATFTGAARTTIVRDNELDHLVWDAISSSKTVGMAFLATVRAKNVSNETITVYAATASLRGAGSKGAVTLTPTTCTFASGVWTGSVTVSTVDTGVTLTVDDGAGHTATSGAFDVSAGVLDHFQWSTVATPQYAGVPIPTPVTITAVDANGYTIPGFVGPVNVSAMSGPANLQIGTGTSSDSVPLHSFFYKARAQVIYLASELGGSTVIRGLALDVTKKPGRVMNRWTIRMKHTTIAAYTTDTRIWEGPNSGWTTVYQANENITATGWVTFNFTTPFVYNGVDNLMIDYSFNDSSYGPEDGTSRYTSVGTTRTIHQWGYDVDPLTWEGTSPSAWWNNNIPNIQLVRAHSLAVTPTTVDTFTNGTWSGYVTVQEAGDPAWLRATAAGDYSGNSNSFAVLAAPPLSVAAPSSAVEDAGLLGGMGTVTLPVTMLTDVVVTLFSSDISEVSVPSSVTIPAGQTTAKFDLTVWDDSELDGTQSVTITATAAIFPAGNAAIAIHDTESAVLSVSIPANATEGDGVLTGQGTVTVSSRVDADLSVSLVSSDTTEVTVPATVVILAGQTSAAFNLSIVDESLIDGPQSATILAHVQNWTDGSASMVVADNDRFLTVTLPVDAWEGQGTLSAAGTVSIQGPLASDLIVSLACSDATELIVAASVTIPAGQTSATFNMAIADDFEQDGYQTPTVTATAATFSDGTRSMVVRDNELDHFTWSIIASPKTGKVPFSAMVVARNINDESIVVYAGTAALSAAGEHGPLSVSPASCTLASGVWTGNVTVNAVDSGVVLTATSSGSSGASNAFDVVAGPLAQFQWNTVASPQYVGWPVAATLTAADANGFTVPGFNGPVNVNGYVAAANAQIGTGTITWYEPMATTFQDSRTQAIYLASELGGSSELRGLSLNVSSVSAQTMNNWTIRIKHTTLSSYSTYAWEGPSSGWTTVYQATQTISATGWVTFSFTTPFLYNGTDNLMIDFSFNNSVGGSSAYCFATSTAATRAVHGVSSSTNGDPLDWTGTSPYVYSDTYLPNIQLVRAVPVSITPTATGTFTGGVWNGAITVQQTATAMYLRAKDPSRHLGDSNTFNVLTVPALALSVPASPLETAGVLAGAGSVTLPFAVATDVTVSLASSDTSEATVPATVTIPAGQLSASFAVTVVDDADLDGTQTATITASATGFPAGTGTIAVRDNETTVITVAIPSTATEGAGVLTGTITLSGASATDVAVALTSSDTTEVTVPATVTIRAGQTTATFNLTVVDDSLIDGTQTATVTAHVDNWTDGGASIAISDNDRFLTVTLLSEAWEGQGVRTAGGSVTIQSALATNLVVTLASNDTSELTVPASVTILAGQTTATFDLTVVDDGLQDGVQTVTVTASSATFTDGVRTTVVRDNELVGFTWDPISTPKTAGTGFSATVRAKNIAGETILVFSSTVSLAAAGAHGSVAISPTSMTFSSGAWTNNITVNAVETAVVLTATYGSVAGSSNAFDVVAGAVDHFQWSTIATPQYQSTPFAATVTAVDSHGYTATSFTGTANLTSVANLANQQIGTGTSTWSYPLYTYYHDARTQVIYLASELGGASTLRGLALYVSTTPGQTLNSWTIRIKPTALSSYATYSWEGPSSGWTTVYQANQAISTTGWVTFTFATPFAYNGTDNLMIDYSYNNSSYTSSGACRYTAASQPRALYYATDSSYNNPLNWSGTSSPSPSGSTYVPNIQLVRSRTVGVSPATTGAFTNGVWSGAVAVQEVVSQVTLRANDGSGHTGDSNLFDVLAGGNHPPVAEAGGAYSGVEGGTLALDGSGTTDLDQANTTLSYQWDMDGDGVFGETGAAAVRGNETGIAPTFSAAGLEGPSAWTVSLRVTDAGGLTSTDTATVVLANAAPTVNAGADATIHAGQVFAQSGSFADPGPDAWTATVDYGDGTGVQTLALNADKTFALSHTFAAGDWTVTIRVTDDDGATGSDTLVVHVDGVPPVVSGTTPSLSTGMLLAGSTSLAIAFSEAVLGASTAANYQLQSLGADGLLGTADDTIIALGASYAGTTTTLSFAALPSSVYRLTVLSTITDAAGNALDGDGNGSAGGSWMEDFVVLGSASGAATFAAVATYSSAGKDVYALAAGDVNHDGLPDLVAANNAIGATNLAVLLNSGNGTFGTATTYSASQPSGVVCADFNGDGWGDIAAEYTGTSKIQVMLNAGNGTFGASTLYGSGGLPYTLTTADFNGDGWTDLAAVNPGFGNVGVLLNNGDGTFGTATTASSGGTQPKNAAAADFNGDGKIDLAAANYNSDNLGVMIGNGNGTFNAAVTYTTGDTGAWDVIAGDFNGDNHPDLAVANIEHGTAGADTVGVLLNNGNGTFAAATAYTAGRMSFTALRAADLNLDGCLDLAVVNTSDSNVGVFLGNGNGTFGAMTTYTTGGTSPVSLAAADFNGDSRPDLAMGHAGTAPLGVLLNTSGPASATLATVHGLAIDIQAKGFMAGQLIQGPSNAFDGLNRLRVAEADFATGSPAFTDDGGQSVIVSTQSLSGLNVHREVTVPNTGDEDFVRTVDVLENSTAGAITATVRIVGNLGSDAATAVFGTSDGDSELEPGDQWIGTDDADGSGAPAIVHYIHGPTGLQPVSVVRTGDNVEWAYHVTVPAGQTLRLAHFTILADSRAAAIAQANVLVTASAFGGQAAAFLSADELASIRNFYSNQPPVAQAGGPYAVAEGSTAALSAAGSSDPEQASTGLVYQWDLDGDGVFGETGAAAARGEETGMTPSFAANGLDGPGVCTVSLRATDNGGLTATSTATINLTNAAPAVHAGADALVAFGQTFARSGSFADAGPDTWTATVDYGDGTGVQPLALSADKTFALNHAYAGGDYTVTVTVTDDDGGAGVDTVLVHVDLVAPEVIDVIDVTPDPRFTAVASVDVVFSEAIDLATFTFADVTLSCNGTAVALSAAVSTSLVSGTTYRISGLDAFTAADGSYQITVSGAGIRDLAGNTGTGSASDAWKTGPMVITVTGPIDEGQTATASGTLASAPTTAFTVQLDWGDGSHSELNLAAGTSSFSTTHTYADDNPSGTPSDPYQVTADIILPGLQFGFAGGMGGTGNDDVLDMAVDASGNVYAVGRLEGSGDFDPGPGTLTLTSLGSTDAFIVKLSPTGSLLWAKRFGGGGVDAPYGAVLDAGGNLYLAGRFSGTVDFDPGPGVSNLTVAGGDDAFVCKLSPDGELVWAKQMGGTYSEIARSLTLDPVGNVLVCGEFNGTADFDPTGSHTSLTSAGISDVFVLKLDSAGGFLWVRGMGSTATDFGNSVAVDAAGNVYTGGWFQGTMDFDPGPAVYNLSSTGASMDVFVSKLDPSGTFLWARAMGGSETDQFYRLTVDGAGHVVSTGVFAGTADFDPGAGQSLLTSAGGNDVFVSALTAAGDLAWAKRIGNTYNDAGTTLVRTADGGVCVAGYFQGTVDFDPGAGTYNLTSILTAGYLLQLDTAGNFGWASPIGQAVSGSHGPNTLRTDSAGSLYSGGWFHLTIDFDPGAGTANVISAGYWDAFVSKLLQTHWTATSTVTVRNVAPTVAAGLDGTVGQGKLFTQSGSFTDPGSDRWTAIVDYGDGSGAQPLTLDGTNFTLSHAFASGDNVVTVTVTDDDGGTASDTLVVHVDPPPVVVSTAPATGGAMVAGTNWLAINFNEPVTNASAAANYQLQGVGPDGLLGTPDDIVVPLSVSYAGTTSRLTFSSLAESVYRLTVREAIQDSLGNSLDGDANGTAGGDWVSDFCVTPPEGRTFGTVAVSAVAPYATPRALVAADFSGDGVLDLVTANASSSNLTLSLGDGSGGFTIATTIPLGGGNLNAVAVGDFNADGKRDLVVTNNVSAIVVLASDSGFLAPATYSTGGANPAAVAVGDFNADGKADLAVANYGSGTVGVLLGNGTGAFAGPTLYAAGGSNTMGITTGDFNADGKQDLAVANYSSGNVGVLLGNGSGGFANPATFSTGAQYPSSVAAGDFNSDGIKDLVVTNYTSSSVSVLLGNGAGGFGSATAYGSGGSYPAAVVVADFNADAKSDLAVANSSGNTVGILIGSGSGSFAAATTYASGGISPYGLAVGDFNGDAKTDLAVANSGNANVGILLGNGSGGFAAAVLVAAGSTAVYGVAAGDFNGDGATDFAVPNYASASVSVLLGNGSGGQASPVVYASGGVNPYSVATGDFNADGKTDLAVTNYASNTIGILLGNGAGGFAAVVTYACGGAYPGSIVSGDFNGDARLDLAVANVNSGTVGVLLGNGAGGFATAITYASGGSSPNCVITGDFNADAKTDLAVSNGNSASVGVLLGNGAGGFAGVVAYPSGGTWVTSVCAGDFNGDGKADLAAAHGSSANVGVLLGNGAGEFAAAVMYTSGGTNLTSVVAGDFNADGKADLAVANGANNTVGVLLANNTGGFAAAVGYLAGGGLPKYLLAGDYSGDGKIDLAVANLSSGNVGVLLGTGDGGFAGAVNGSAGGSNQYTVTTGDFNADGKADIAVPNFSSDTLGILLGNGTGAFAATVTYPSGASQPYHVAVGDFNGDGKADLAVAGYKNANVAILLGTGDGSFGTAVTYACGASPVFVATDDFNADGKTDIAVVNSGSNSVGVLLGNGSGGFSSATAYACGGSQPYGLATADFNGDAKRDLAVTHYSGSTIGILLGNGSGGFASAATYATGGSGPRSVAAGDFNTDGKADLAVANSFTATVGLLLGNGSGGFAAPMSWPSGGQSPQSVTTGDFNGDATTDVVVANTSSGGLGVLFGNGLGGLAMAVPYMGNGWSSQFATGGDFNADGKPDIAVVHSNYTVAALLNSADHRISVRDLNSPGALRFSVQTTGFGAGQLVDGSGGAFDGTGRLELAGWPYAPTAANDVLTDGGRTVVTPSVVIAGLYASREITVPAAGNEDFARTVDVFTNPTASPITTTVRIVGNLGSGAATTVWNTSDGDTEWEPADQWFGTDDADGSGSPAIIHYIHGPVGLQPASVLRTGDNLEWTYHLTVPAGQAVRLAHFTIVAATRAQAEAAAAVLVTPASFGGQAAAFLSSAELTSIINFNRPPVAIAQALSTAEDTPLAITLTATDPEGASPAYTVLTPPAHGTLSGTAPHLTYTPQANYAGTDSFTFEAFDGVLHSSSATVAITVTPVADIAGRFLFYNNSAFDGGDPAVNSADYNAVAPAPSILGHGHAGGLDEPTKQLGKQALLPGQTASFVNYSSYAKGLNGILIAFDELADPTAVDLSDFVFFVGNSDAPAEWTTAPIPASIRVEQNVVHPNFPGQPDVVTITWADENPYTPAREADAISNQWLQVKVLAGAHTGLAADDVFYFGNQIGESGNSATDANVDQNDEIGARNHPHTAFNPAAISDPYDFNRDGKVDQNDEILARNTPASAFTRIQLIATPAMLQSQGSPADGQVGQTLTREALAPVVAEAISRWEAAGLDAGQRQLLQQTQFAVARFHGRQLGEASPNSNTVYLDDDAAGFGWFLDRTPARDEEFSPASGDDSPVTSDRPAVAKIDLLTAVMHELGHVLGKSDLESATDDLMADRLAAGMRRSWSARLPGIHDAVFADHAAG